MDIHPAGFAGREPGNAAEHAAITTAGKRIARSSHGRLGRKRLERRKSAVRIRGDIVNPAETQVPQLAELRPAIAHHLARRRPLCRRKSEVPHDTTDRRFEHIIAQVEKVRIPPAWAIMHRSGEHRLPVCHRHITLQQHGDIMLRVHRIHQILSRGNLHRLFTIAQDSLHGLIPHLLRPERSRHEKRLGTAHTPGNWFQHVHSPNLIRTTPLVNTDFRNFRSCPPAKAPAVGPNSQSGDF